MATVRKNVALSFGLLTATVNVVSAIQPKARNVTVCTGAAGKPEHAPVRIRQRLNCAECGEIEYHEVKRAREVPDGLVLLTDEDRKEIAVDAEQFKNAVKMTPHPAEAVDLNTAPGERAYYLECAPGHEQSYTVIRHLIESHGELAFMVRYTPRSNMGVYRAMVRDGALLLQERISGEQYVEAPGMNPIEVPEALLGMGEQVLTLPGVIVDFDLESYRDSSEDKIAAIIASRAPQAEIVPEGDAKAPAPVKDAMSALAAMLATPEPAAKPAKKAAAKKAAARKKAS